MMDYFTGGLLLRIFYPFSGTMMSPEWRQDCPTIGIFPCGLLLSFEKGNLKCETSQDIKYVCFGPDLKRSWLIN